MLFRSELSLSEVRLVGGYGLCDTCNGFAENGYLIPVLGTYWMCPKCYEEWNKHSKLEEEDKEYEEQNYQRWLEILKENEADYAVNVNIGFRFG